jgi:hypothetical protein
MSNLEKITKFLSDLRRASRFYQVPYPIALFRSLRLYLRLEFSRKEIIGYGLFVPPITANIPVLISKERSLSILGAVNPPAFQHLTENKDEFYRICRDRGLPIPETYGWTMDGRCYDAEGRRIEGNQAWSRYLLARLPEDFIVKDRAGAYGSGFRAFHRSGDAFQSADDGPACDITSLSLALTVPGESEGSIIQKRLFDAAPLAALSGRHGLQTMRINTLLHPDGRVSILFYMIKILAGHTVSDNFSMGTTGNLIAYGDPDNGTLRGALTIHECGSGMTAVAAHPETGIRFAGFTLPYWSDAMALVATAQRFFPELPTLGWDIALTEDGPIIIEANARWDPPLYAPFLMSTDNWQRVFGGPRPVPQ